MEVELDFSIAYHPVGTEQVAGDGHGKAKQGKGAGGILLFFSALRSPGPGLEADHGLRNSSSFCGKRF
jgi:hypothetical protein